MNVSLFSRLLRSIPLVQLTIALLAVESAQLHAQNVDAPAPSAIQDESSGPSSDSASDSKRKELTFSFRKTPWEDVLLWIADESDLIFNLDYTPPGTLNFVDTDRKYTPDEALDEINGQLLARGYTLVRRNRNLFIVDLEEDIDRKFVSDLLTITPLDELSSRGRFELTKAKFQLKSISAEDAEKQIEEMVGPQGLIITIPLARQLIVSETGENLRRIRDVLDAVESRVGSEGLRSFRLQHAVGEDVLAVAKPLLGIEADKSAAEDGSIQISTDTKGQVVYATGEPGKLALVEQIAIQVDGDAAANVVDAQLKLRSHRVRREDPEVVLRILETLFRGDALIRLQTRADSVLAFATEEQHATILATIKEVEQEPSRIEVIPLRRNDPMLAVALIERMFGVGGEEEIESAPVIDAMFDPAQLVVRGSAAQIDQIRSLLGDMGERMDEDGRVLGPTTRMVPIYADQMPMAIEQLRQMWPTLGNGNRIRIINQPQTPLIRVVPRAAEETNQDSELQQPTETDNTTEVGRYRTAYVGSPVAQADDASTPAEDASVPAAKDPQDIIIYSTPQGLAIVSKDTPAVDALENLLLGIASNNGNNSRYSLFHLKHVDAEETVTLLQDLFSAGAAASGGGETSRSGIMGLMAGGGNSSITAPRIIADKRINRLFVQGTSSQIRHVEQYLKVIDVEDGPVDVQTNPKPTYIPVFYTSAESIVEILKELYADRVFDSNARTRQTSSRGGFPGFGGFGGRGGGDRGSAPSSRSTTTGDVPKMTIAADASSNLVIVSAPGPLLKEVEEVVRELDVRAQTAPAEDFVVGRLAAGASPSVIKQALVGVYGDFIRTDGEGLASSSSSSSSTNTNRTNSTADAQAQRRAAFFEMIRGGGRPVGGSRGGGGTTGRDRGRGGSAGGGRGAGGIRSSGGGRGR